MNGTCYTRSVVARKPKIRYKYYNLKTKKVVNDKKTLQDLAEIKIPATYTRVILCPSSKNKLQATAYDGTGRKQYFYSKKHVDNARKEKYCNLVFLGMQLPNILKDIDFLTRQSKIDLDVLNGMALQIMLICNFRVGTTQNRDRYETYGLSTLTPEHVKFSGNKAVIKFVGKKKQVNECTLNDPGTVRILKKLVDHNRRRVTRGGKKYLFSWEGTRVTPDSLNEFLGRYHEDITTKTWRTWFANLRYIALMRQQKIEETKTKRKRSSNQIVKRVAEDLHHTPAICKKNYLMTELTDLYVEHPDKWKAQNKNKSPDKFFLGFLKAYYCLTPGWIRRRSRSRSRKVSRRGERNNSRNFDRELKELGVKALDAKTMKLKSSIGEYVHQGGKRRTQRSISSDESSSDESSSDESSSDSGSYESYYSD